MAVTGIPYKGTYKPDFKLHVQEKDNILIITDPVSKKVIAEHPVSNKKGALIRNNNHSRQYDNKIEELYQKTLSQQPLFLRLFAKKKAGIYGINMD